MHQKEIEKITNYIFLKSSLQQADLALVFGTRHIEVINQIYKLYQDKFINKILVSGGINRINNKNEALEISKKLISLEVEQQDIILEDQSTNSLENVLFSKKIIDERFGFNNIKKIIVVAKHYHSRRALMTLKKHFHGTVKLMLAPYELYGFTKNNWFENEVGKKKVMSEWKKIQKYLKKGDIKEL